MLAIEINRSLCTKCGKCIDICCNSRVIAADEDNYPIYKNIHKCISCGHCIAICPQNAISTKNTKPSDKYFIITESRPLVKPHLSPEHIHSLLAEIRSERTFTNKQVEKEKLEQVLEVMMQSPSAGNEQNRNYYIFTNQADIQSLEEDIQTMNLKQTGIFTNPLFRKIMAKSMEKRCLSVYKENGITLSKEQTAECISQVFDSITTKDPDFFLRKAPALFIITYNTAQNGMHKDFYKTDIGIAITNGIILGSALGLSSCRLGLAEIFLNKSEALKAKYGISKNEKIGGVFSLGYSTTEWQRIPPRGPSKVIWN